MSSYPLIKLGSEIEDFIKGTGYLFMKGDEILIAPRQGWFKKVEGGWEPMWSFNLPKELKEEYIESLEDEIEYTKTGKSKLKIEV